MYMCTVLETKKDVNVFNSHVVPIDLKWADGMIGVMPVFDTQQHAEEYLGESAAKIYELEAANDTEEN